VAEVILFHHVLGLGEGVIAFADELRAAGHVVHTPDLYEGRTFTEIADGVAYEESIGFAGIVERARAAAEDLPSELVYAGFSAGVLPAEALATTRPDAKGALFFHGCLPPSYFDGGWPEDVALEIHMMEADPFALEGDLDVARELADSVDGVELYLYPGDGHLFADRTQPDYDEPAAALLMERVLAFLERVG
jgi:dienelactone hydrolase